MFKVLHYGPWFLFGHFLSVQLWEPNFVATEAKRSLYIVVWVRLPQLLTEFYDGIIFEKLGIPLVDYLKLILAHILL